MKIAHVKEYGKTTTQVYVGKGSSLANPYDKFYGQKTGNASVQAYRAWLWKKVRTQDKSVMRLMHVMHEDSTLLCYCQDDSCHTPIIVKAWSWLKSQGLVDKTPAKQAPDIFDIYLDLLDSTDLEDTEPGMQVLTVTEEQQMRSDIAEMETILAQLEAQDIDEYTYQEPCFDDAGLTI